MLDMIPEEEKLTLVAAHMTFGEDVQLGLSIEEIGEVLSHLGGIIRGRPVGDAHEEIADIRIMADQLAVMYGEEEVEEAYNEKLERLDDRIGEAIEDV